MSPSETAVSGGATRDTVEGQIRGPKDGERYFALLKVNKINFDYLVSGTRCISTI